MLPSNTIPNPQEDLKAITTPSVQPSPASTSSELPTDHVSSPVIPEQNPYQPPIPYPSRLNKEKLQDKADIQIHSFFKMFKKLYFNISLAEALAHMPKFAKMVKDLLSNKEKILEPSNTPLNKNCSAVLLKKLPEKLRDTERFPFHTLSLPELNPTRMTLELATRTVSYPASIVEDVFMQVGKFTFPADFVVVDYDVDHRVPLILERPFFRTAHALVNHGDDSIHKIDILDITCEDHFHEVLNVQKSINPMSGSPTPSSDPVVASHSPSLNPFRDIDFILEEIDAFLVSNDSTSPNIDDGTFDMEGDIRLIETLLNNEILNDLPPPLSMFVINETEKIKSSIDDPPDLELKDLTPHLEYVFLEGTSKLSVMIAKELKREEKEHLLKEKTTFTCPYKTFAYRRMSFDLCNVLGTFQRCMVAIFHDMIEKTMKVFMDDFLAFGDSFSSDFNVGAILGQRKDKYFRPIHYANHSALKYLFAKQDAKPRLLWWILLLQEFNIEIRDKKRAENLAADHLSILENPHLGDLVGLEMNDHFPHESLNMISLYPDNEPPWFADIVNYLVGEHQAKWADKLDDALWAFRTAFKAAIGCTPYKPVYGKTCHLPIELEHEAYRALK
nr:hypothetical protein [Tanacetum cinerariifolium]